MFMFILLALIVFAIYIYPKRDNDKLKDLKFEVYKYSGLNPDLYYRFLNNIQLMDQTIQSVETSSGYLYEALDNLQDMALNAKGGSSGLIENLHDIASRIGNAAELTILDNALRQGVRFYPKYIKNTPDTKLFDFCVQYPNAPECNSKRLIDPVNAT